MNQIRLVVLFVLAMAMQWWWMTHFSFFGVAPQLLLVLTVAMASRHGAVWAMLYGFLWGLFLDVLSPRLFGANALALTLVAYGTGSVRRQIDVAGLAPQALVVFGVTWGYFLLLGVLALVFTPGHKSFDWVGWPSFLVDPFLNILLTGLVYALWDPRVEHRHR